VGRREAAVVQRRSMRGLFVIFSCSDAACIFATCGSLPLSSILARCKARVVSSWRPAVLRTEQVGRRRRKARTLVAASLSSCSPPYQSGECARSFRCVRKMPSRSSRRSRIKHLVWRALIRTQTEHRRQSRLALVTNLDKGSQPHAE